MPKKDTKLEKLSEKIQITAEEIRNLGIENFDYMSMEIYVEQAAGLTDSRQPEKVNHPPERCCGDCLFRGPVRK